MRSLITLADLPDTPLHPEELFDLEAAYVDTLAATPHAEERYGHFHPSANNSCGRKNVYEYTRTPALSYAQIYKILSTRDKVLTGAKLSAQQKEERDMTPDVAKDLDTLDFGHSVHHLILERRLAQIETHLVAQGYEVKIEVEKAHDPATDFLRLNFDLGGTSDGLLTITNPAGVTQRGVLEVKSIKDNGFHELARAKPEHLAQANLYALRNDIPGIWIWYFNKNDSDRRVFRHFFDPVLADQTLAKYAAWKAHADAGTLPLRDENWWMCARCPWQHVCKPRILSHGGLSPSQAAVARARNRPGFGGTKLTTIRRKP